MFCEVGLECELLATPATTEGLDVAVCLHVSPQVTLVSEALAALVTAEWFLSSVSSDVTLEQPRSGERLATERTLAARGVGPHVHAEGGRAAVLLAAHPARLGRAGGVSGRFGLDCQVQGLALLCSLARRGIRNLWH